MKQDFTLQPAKACLTPKKVKGLSSFQSAFLLLMVFALSASADAQTVDYNLPKNWMCHPVLKSTDVAREQNLSLTVRNPDLSIDTVIHYTHYAESLVDIFYIYPTIDLDTLMNNTAMGSIDTATAKFVYREQVGIYARFGRVFAPYYRQAKIRVFADKVFSDSTQRLRANCMEIAYNDIDSAFSHYLQHYNNGRKIILMGHSQGAYLMRFLLRKRFDNNPALLSQLVVAISGGEPNYVSASGSRTGGSLQNIKACPPRNSVQECGCIINWRTWNKIHPFTYLYKNSFFFNKYFVDKGLIYQAYDTVNKSHIESIYDFGYSSAQKTIPRYITLDSTMGNYLAFDRLFKAEITNEPAKPGSAYLLIDSIFTPGDHRKTGKFPGLVSFLQDTIPIDTATSNFHVWDMQFVQWDLLNILPDLIARCSKKGVPEKNSPQNAALNKLNTTNGMMHANDNNQKIGNARDFLFLTPDQQPDAYRNIDKLFSTRTFKRGKSVFPLPPSDQPLTSVKYSPDGVNTYDIDDFVKRNRVSGLLIIKDGKIVLERYALGNNDSSRWTSFSVAKSFTSTLIGMAIKDGLIKSLDDKVTDYLPQMRGTSYDGVTVGQLMTMSSGVDWNEDYRESASSLTALFKCPLEGKKGGMIAVMSKLPRAAAPGKKFLYSTGETCLEGEVLTAALKGETMSGYLSRKLWAKMGMEADGYWLLESPGGHEFAGGNLSMTLRDYGRFGMFILNNGIINGNSLLPSGWVSQISRPPANAPQLAYGKLYSAVNSPEQPYYYPFGYSYNWWCMDQSPWGAWEALDNTTVWGADAIKAPKEKFTNLLGTFSAIGIFGQYIHVNQKENMVTVIWSAWKDPNLDPKEYEVMCFLNAATGYLHR